MTAVPSIRFYFDFVSPYSYIAWHLVRRVAAKDGRSVEPVPVLFAGLLDALGTRGPAEVPARRRYMIRDVVRKAADAGVPIELPAAHPFNPLLALRLSSLPLQPADRFALIDAFWSAIWAGGPGVATAEAAARVLERVGLPLRLIDEAQTGESKERVKAQTAGALSLGVFGVPTMIVGEELFFGTDSIPHLERFLVGRDVVRPELVAKWEQLPAGATRSAAGP
jgi:2-hydroxychromene-2-carboxylate isomerase